MLGTLPGGLPSRPAALCPRGWDGAAGRRGCFVANSKPQTKPGRRSANRSPHVVGVSCLPVSHRQAVLYCQEPRRNSRWRLLDLNRCSVRVANAEPERERAKATKRCARSARAAKMADWQCFCTLNKPDAECWVCSQGAPTSERRRHPPAPAPRRRATRRRRRCRRRRHKHQCRARRRRGRRHRHPADATKKKPPIDLTAVRRRVAMKPRMAEASRRGHDDHPCIGKRRAQTKSSTTASENDEPLPQRLWRRSGFRTTEERQRAVRPPPASAEQDAGAGVASIT